MYPSKNGSNGEGPSRRSPKQVKNNPITIIDQWLFTLSANMPQPGLESPYMAEMSKNRSPTFCGLKSNYNNK